MPIERFYAEVTVPFGEIERILRLAWRNGNEPGPIFAALKETRGNLSVYTLDPISEGFARWLERFGAKVKRVTRPKRLGVPPRPY